MFEGLFDIYFIMVIIPAIIELNNYNCNNNNNDNEAESTTYAAIDKLGSWNCELCLIQNNNVRNLVYRKYQSFFNNMNSIIYQSK